MPLILFPTVTDVEDDHDLEFAVVDICPELLNRLARRCDFVSSVLRQDEKLSEVSYWDQSCDYYRFEVIHDLLEGIQSIGLNLPTDLLDLDESLIIPFRPAPQPELADCREMCISPDTRRGDHFIQWRAFPQHSDTVVLTPELPLSELREFADPQPRKEDRH